MTCPWGVVVFGCRTFTDLVFAHMADAVQRHIWGVGGSENLAVCGEHQENRACRREMHAKRLPNNVHNHAMAPDDNVCSYFFQLAVFRLKPAFVIMRN